MRFVKRNRATIIIVLVFILLALFGIKVKDILIPDSKESMYGNRLTDEKKYEVDKSSLKKMLEEMAAKDNVKEITYHKQGRTYNVSITLVDEGSIQDAKNLGDTVLTYFTEKNLKYYSVQIFVSKEDKKLNNFPIVGMKDPLSEKITWSKNRDISEETTNEGKK